jgi:hypothetical protein
MMLFFMDSLIFFEHLRVFWEDRLMCITCTSREEAREDAMYESHTSSLYGLASKEECELLMLPVADTMPVKMSIEHRRKSEEYNLFRKMFGV